MELVSVGAVNVPIVKSPTTATALPSNVQVAALPVPVMTVSSLLPVLPTVTESLVPGAMMGDDGVVSVQFAGSPQAPPEMPV